MLDLSIHIPDTINRLPAHKRRELQKVLNILFEVRELQGIVWGGSIPYTQDISRSDIDLFCWVSDIEKVMEIIGKFAFSINTVEHVTYQGYFPWSGMLFTLYFKNDLDFTIDIGLISESHSKNFFTDPRGLILFDKHGKVKEQLRKQNALYPDDFVPFLKSTPFAQAIIALKKIDKNLSRGHLWNAFEQTNMFRRYIMQIIRLYKLKDHSFIGRVDRDIENVLPDSLRKKLEKTVPVFTTKDIADKAALLASLLLSLISYADASKEGQSIPWIKKQLQHEISKLQSYIQ